MVDRAHSILTGADIHEPKGADTALSGTIYVSDGGGGGVWTDINHTQMGIYDYSDLTTQSSPIALSLANTQYVLTNDGAGVETNLGGAFSDVANLWVTGTNRFNFTGLSQYDTVDIRLDVTAITTAANTSIDFAVEFGVGATPYQISWLQTANIKTAGTYRFTQYNGIFMGNSLTLNNPARVLARADSTGVTVKVNGWYIKAVRNV